MRRETAVVQNKHGFHLRAVTAIVKALQEFTSEVTVSKDGIKRNGRSVLDLMLLEATEGTALTIEVTGDDENEAILRILELFVARFGEE